MNPVTNYVMIVSEHAKTRIDDRYKNLTPVDFLNSAFELVSDDMTAQYIAMAKPASRKQLEKGYREIVLFSDLGVYGVVNKANLELVTVFPNGNIYTKPPNYDKLKLCEKLRDKIKCAQYMSYTKRQIKDFRIGKEFDRVCRDLAALKREIKENRLKQRKQEEASELTLLKRFVRDRFGEACLLEYHREVDKLRSQHDQTQRDA